MPWEIDSRVGEKLKYEPTINVSLLNALKSMVRAFGIEGTTEKDRNAAFDEAFEALWKVEHIGGRAETLKDATASDTPPSQADGPDYYSYREFPKEGEWGDTWADMHRSMGNVDFYRATYFNEENPNPPYPYGFYLEGWDKRPDGELPEFNFPLQYAAEDKS